MKHWYSRSGAARGSIFAIPRSTPILSLSRTFVMVVLLSAFALLPRYASASDFGVPLPDGAGIGLRIPLGNEKTTSQDNEVQLFLLMGRQKVVRMESPVHGRFVRVRIGALKFKKYNNIGRGHISRRSRIQGARRKQVEAVTARRPDRINRIASSDRNKVLASAQPSATGSTRRVTGSPSAWKAYAQSVSVYDALRRSYLRMKNKRSARAKRLHTKMMQAYEFALRLRSKPGVRQ